MRSEAWRSRVLKDGKAGKKDFCLGFVEFEVTVSHPGRIGAVLMKKKIISWDFLSSASFSAPQMEGIEMPASFQFSSTH